MKRCDDCIHDSVCAQTWRMADGCSYYEEQRPHGEWGEWDEDKGYPCSNCGEYLPYSEEYDYQTNFCPKCGAPMNEIALEILRKREGGAE